MFTDVSLGIQTYYNNKRMLEFEIKKNYVIGIVNSSFMQSQYLLFFSELHK